MRALTRSIATVRLNLRLLGVLVWTWFTVTCAELGERLLPSRRKDPIANRARWKMIWTKLAPWIVGLDIRVVRGAGDPGVGRARLVVANHRTPLDVISLMTLFGGHFLANHRVASAPIVGRAANVIGTLFVDRSDRKSGVAAIRAMRKVLEDGRTVVVFPEGTTFEGDEVRPFKGGAFTAAQGLTVEVVPVGLAYAPGHELGEQRMGTHVRGFLARRRTPVWVAIGEPIPVPEDRKGFDERVHARVQELVDEARAASRSEQR